MKWINAEQQVIVTIYDEEHEEHLVKMMTVEEMLDTYTNDGCPTMYSNPERKRGEWVLKDGTPIDHELEMMEEAFCNQCGNSAPGIPFWDCDLDLTNFCPNCGADMRKEVKK